MKTFTITGKKKMSRKTSRFGAQHIGERAYFNVFSAIRHEMAKEVERDRGRPGISIEFESEGVHDRGWRYETYIVTSNRPFDPRVDEIADGLHALSSWLFRRALPGDASSVDLF